jgi:hypothetical protein
MVVEVSSLLGNALGFTLRGKMGEGHQPPVPQFPELEASTTYLPCLALDGGGQGRVYYIIKTPTKK